MHAGVFVAPGSVYFKLTLSKVCLFLKSHVAVYKKALYVTQAGVFVANRNVSPRPQRPLSPRDQPSAAPSPQGQFAPHHKF